MRLIIGALAAITLVTQAPAAVLQSDSIRLEVDEAAQVISLTATCRDAGLIETGAPLASARVDGALVSATAATVEGNRLTLTFGETGVIATLSWEARGDLLLVTLEGATGEPEELNFLLVRLLPGAEVLCSRHVLKYPDASLALIAEQPECLIRGGGGKKPYLMASTYPDVKLAPGRVALMAAPWEELPDAIQRAEELFGIPLGIRAKRSDAARGSYFMLTGVTQDNAEMVVDWGKRGGFGSILMVHGTWGHFGHRYAVPAKTFPGGIEALRETVDSIHAAGMLAGAHMFSSKVPKTCDWSKGKAERRLYQDRFLALAQPMDEAADRIVTTEPPVDWPVLTGTRDIRIDDELMSYTDLSLEEPFGFTGVKRAVYGTDPQAHVANVPVAHVKTDESRGIFIIDQNTDMLDEHAQDIANTYNAAGFDWIYFDGAEDVHNPRWYTTSNAMTAVIEKLNREPALVQAAAGSPFAWHLVTRVGQRDYFWVSESSKDEVDDAVARGVPRARREMIIADLGWFQLKPSSQHVRGTQLDDVEYLCAKTLACNMTYSIQGRVSSLRSIPALDAMLYVMGRYEYHKFAGTFSDDVLERVLTPHQDFMLVELPRKAPRLVRARELPYCARTGHLVRAMRADAVDGVHVVSLAPVSRGATIEFSFDKRRVEFVDYKGDPWPVEWLPGSRVRVPVTTRVLMRVTGGSANIRDELRRARASIIKPAMIVIDAAKPDRMEGSFALASEVGAGAPGAISDVIVPTAGMNSTTGANHWLEYDIEVPEAGRYHLWIRARYLDTNANSFFLHDLDNPDEPIRLGNRIGDYGHFIWDGGVPLELTAGALTLRVTGREARPNESPMLDFLALVREDHLYTPTDSDVGASLQQ